MRLRFESQNGTKVEPISEKELDLLLDSIDGKDNSFASLDLHNGTYMQVGGGPSEFTVEVRIILPDDRFDHFKACTNVKSIGEKIIIVGGRAVKVNSNQVLSLAMVKSLFQEFFRGNVKPEIIDWERMALFKD